MRLGVAVPMAGSWATAENMVEIATAAERLGYSSLWGFQRLLSPLDGDRPLLDLSYRAVQDPLTTLAFLAGQTTAIRLGTAIVNMPFYSPILLARMLTTIDRLSGGRLDAGLGIGWAEPEFAAAGASTDRRGQRAEEFIECLKVIWTEPVVEFSGRFYRVPRAEVEPKPVQKPHPPILLGGTADVALRRAGRLAAGWISSSRADLTRIGESIAVVKKAAVAAGRTVDDLRFVCRGVTKVRKDERRPLTGSVDEIRQDLDDLAAQGVTETFLDLNFDPEIGSPDSDPAASMRRAHELLDALAPAR